MIQSLRDPVLQKLTDQPLALLGGPAAVGDAQGDESMFHWPIVTEEDERAVVDVLRAGAMSGGAITRQFETAIARWMGVEHALGCCNGTAALLASMWACGVGAGDEVICPSITYWASCMPALHLGATVNFADIDPHTLCINPEDIEHRIGPRTRAIIVVHYAGYPCDMERILPIAREHGIAVIEDVSHAHGARYKGRMCGTLGDIAAMSMMTGKGLAVGEGGMVVTDDRSLYERAVAFGHYELTGVIPRFAAPGEVVRDPELRGFAGLAIGAAKHRMNQICSAMGLVQLEHYEARMAEIQRAMNRFWDLLEDMPGLTAHRPADAESTMGGWYMPRGLYDAQALGGLRCERFCQAMRAEGVQTAQPGANGPLHTHRAFHELDVFHQGQPTAVAFGQRDVRQGTGSLPVSERINEIAMGMPWFKHDWPEVIARYAAAFRKVARQADRLLKDTGESAS